MIEIAAGGTEGLAEAIDGFGQFFLGYGLDDRFGFAFGIVPDDPEFVTDDKILN